MTTATIRVSTSVAAAIVEGFPGFRGGVGHGNTEEVGSDGLQRVGPLPAVLLRLGLQLPMGLRARANHLRKKNGALAWAWHKQTNKGRRDGMIKL